MSLLAILPLLLGLALSPPESDSLARDQVVGPLGARLDSQLTRFAEYGFSGTVLVARSGRIVLLKGYGLADVEKGIPNTPATRFEMNSMTKMFTGAAILQLAGEGRLRLNDPVAKYLPGFPPAKQGATIEQLATHTSGLIEEGSDLAGESREAFIRDVARTPRESAPGERYRYSNAGFSLLAATIETVSGETYERYLRRRLFAPAGMRTAVFRDEVPPDDPLFAHGYVGSPAALLPGPPNPYVWGTRGAGGIWSTVGDMYRWVAGLEEKRVLGEAQRRVLLSAPKAPAKEMFGWRVEPDPEGRPRIQKGGGSDDFASQLLYYPREAVAVIWASNNLRQRWRQAVNQAIPALVFTGTPFSLPPVVPLPRATLESRSGRFASGQDTLEIRAGPGYLYATANGLDIPANVMFFPQGSEQFTAFDPATRAVTRLEFGADGQWLAFALPGGRRVPAKRSASALDAAATPTREDAEKSVLEVERRFVTALVSRDEKAFGDLLAADLRHVGFEGQIVGKAEYMEFFKHGNWRYASYLPSDVSVKLSGDMAVVTGRVSRSIAVNGKETTGAFAFTHVWCRPNHEWLLTSSHVTTVP